MKGRLFAGLLLASLAITLPHPARAQCKTPVDPNQVVLFLDLNDSLKEIPSAEAAACENGQTLIVIPPVAGRKDISPIQDTYRRRVREFAACGSSNDCDTKQARAALDIAQTNLSQAAGALPKVTPDLLKARLRELARQGKAIRTLIISSHDGGGEYSGATAYKQLWRSDIVQAIQEAYADSPALLAQLRTLLAWGCYSAAPMEIRSWESDLPSLRIIAGFVGSAPSSSKAAGHEYMRDVLLKSEHALLTTDQVELRKAILGIQGLNSTLAGVYVASCKADFYYSRNYERNYSGPVVAKLTTFMPLAGCRAFSKDVLPGLRSEFTAYLEGTREIPTNTASGPLRQIYSKLRQHAQCVSPDDSMTPDRVALLLFFDGVRENFAAVFRDEIEKAARELANPDPTIRTALDQIVPPLPPEQRAEVTQELKSWMKAQAPLLGQISEQGIRTMSRADLSRFLNHIQELNLRLISPASVMLGLLPATAQLAQNMSTYLYELDPACMPYLEWHEYRPGALPEHGC